MRAAAAPCSCCCADADAPRQALAGDWIDVDGAVGMKGKVAVSYRVTGGGFSVIETLFAGLPHETTTVHHKDGRHVVLTHDCAAGNPPRMRG